MKIVILDAYSTNPGDLSWEWLEDFGEVTVYDRTPKEKILERCEGCEIVITNKTPLGEDILTKLPSLKFIALLSTGYNVVDCECAKRLGVPVSNVPTYSTSAVAQLTFALLLEMTNRVSLHNDAVKNGEWTECKDFCFWKAPLCELEGKTLGIFGFGKIGRAVAGIANAFGMRVLAVTANPSKYTEVEGVEFVTLEKMLNEADAVSLHCPLTPETEKLVNADFLSKMKPSAFLINTSRGPVLDETAVAHALKTKRLAFAGVDVLSTEPPKPDNPLLSCDNCLITPHIAWAGYETRQRLISVVRDNVAAFVAGKPQNVVNK